MPKHEIVITYLGESRYIDDCIKSIELGNKGEDYKIRLIDTLNPRIALAKAWNIGTREADADVVTVLNDDTIVCPDFVKITNDILLSNPEIGALFPTLSDCANFQKAPYLKYGKEFGEIWTIKDAWKIAKFFINHPDLKLVKGLWDGCGCCMSYRKEVFGKVGDFYEGFNPIYGEENDWLDRMLLQDYIIAWEQRLYVHHFRMQTVKNLTDVDKAAMGRLLKLRRAQRGQSDMYSKCGQNMKYWLEDWVNGRV